MKPLSKEIKKFILEYFKCNVFQDSYYLSESVKNNIIQTFTYAYNHHKSKEQLAQELEGSTIEKTRDMIKANNKPFPIRLGTLKPKLQQEAVDQDTTVHSLLREIVVQFLDKVENPPSLQQDKCLRRLWQMARIKRNNHHVYAKKYGYKWNGVQQTQLFELEKRKR